MQEYIADIDKEHYNVVGNNFKEEYFKITMKEINDCHGKMFLYIQDEKLFKRYWM